MKHKRKNETNDNCKELDIVKQVIRDSRNNDHSLTS